MVDDNLGATVGGRVYLIREALGTRRDPMPQRAFAALLQSVRGRKYDAAEISRWETGKGTPSLDDIEDLAAVDPRERGRLWVGWGDTETPPRTAASDAGTGKETTEERHARLVAEVAEVQRQLHATEESSRHPARPEGRSPAAKKTGRRAR